MLRFSRPREGVPVPTFRLKSLQHLLLAAALLSASFALRAQDKRTPSATLKIGFLMDSLKVERWQTDLDNFQKRAGELGAQVLVETAEGDDELQLQQAQKLLSAGVKSLVLVSHDAEKAVRIVTAAKTKNVPLLCNGTFLVLAAVTIRTAFSASWETRTSDFTPALSNFCACWSWSSSSPSAVSTNTCAPSSPARFWKLSRSVCQRSTFRES